VLPIMKAYGVRVKIGKQFGINLEKALNNLSYTDFFVEQEVK
jgi:hypothetical protein